MSHTSAPDYIALPTAMLDLAKAHLRVDFDDDDTVIVDYLGQAISLLEQTWGLSVFSAAVAWTPEPAGLSRYQCPVWPVASFIVTSGAADVSTDYQVERASLTEAPWLAKKDDTAFPDDATVTLSTGYQTPTALVPAMRAGILRVAGTLYEHRESTATVSVEQMPYWLGDLIDGLWVPRA